MTAYAQYRLAKATIERNRDLSRQKLITPKQIPDRSGRVRGGPGDLPEPDGPDGLRGQAGRARGPSRRARQAETSVRVARERLRVLGVKPDGTEPEVAGGQGRRRRARTARSPPADGRPAAEARDDPAPRPGRSRPSSPAGSAADAADPARSPRPEHLLDLGPVRRHDPRPRDDRPGRRRRHDPPDLHPGRPRRRSGSRRTSTRATSPCWPGAATAKVRFRSPAYPGRDVRGRGDLHRRPRRREEPDGQAPGPGREPRPAAQAGHVRRGRGPQPVGPHRRASSPPRPS